MQRMHTKKTDEEGRGEMNKMAPGSVIQAQTPRNVMRVSQATVSITRAAFTLVTRKMAKFAK